MYKDFLFRYLFTNKTTLRHLYNALKQTSCGPDTPLTITTLHEALSSSRRNDLSFTIQDRYKVVIFLAVCCTLEDFGAERQNLPCPRLQCSL